MVKAHPDITFAISVVSRFAKNLSHQYTKAVKTIMQYLKATHTLDIAYGRDQRDLIIKNFPNSD